MGSLGSVRRSPSNMKNKLEIHTKFINWKSTHKKKTILAITGATSNISIIHNMVFVHVVFGKAPGFNRLSRQLFDLMHKCKYGFCMR